MGHPVKICLIIIIIIVIIIIIIILLYFIIIFCIKVFMINQINIIIILLLLLLLLNNLQITSITNADINADIIHLRPPHTSRFFVGRQKICSCRLVCGEFRQVSDKIGACRVRSDSARSQNVLSGLVG